MKRDGEDYKNLLGSLKTLLNTDDYTVAREDVEATVEEYCSNFAGVGTTVGKISDKDSIEAREKKYASMVDNFYNLVTDFYTYGWGESFHFARRLQGESFNESIKRAEYYLASRLGMKEGKKVLDVGCGVGGPMRNIAHFTGADITGVTINDYQVKIGNRYALKQGLQATCRSVKGDFQKLPFGTEHLQEGTFDAAYAIEATCHSPDRAECFGQVFQALKPGALFAGYEWVVTELYDPKNSDHIRIKEGIEVGNGLPTLATAEAVRAALKQAGFEVVEACNVNASCHNGLEIPWYAPLEGSFSWSGFRMSQTGALMTTCLVCILETLRIAPSGTTKVSSILRNTALDLVAGGQAGIFTPGYFFLARKPS